MSSFDAIERLVSGLGFTICESVDILGRPEVRVKVPRAVADGPVSSVLGNLTPDGRVWKHQAKALSHLCLGHNTVVSTGTASGKSLIFQLYSLHRLLTDPGSKILVLYPLRALTNDQMVGWQRLTKLAKLEPETVGCIYGGVPMGEREQILEHSRVILMTPDVCQAWLMRMIGNPQINRFIESLTLLILDEAHVYESVFGSNTAFLLRRLQAAKRRLSPRGTKFNRFEIVAVTATINNPAEHLERLTGSKFHVVDESENGAPRHPRRILHLAGPESGREDESAIGMILDGVCETPDRYRFISFVDSRQGVERIVRAVNKKDVKPYRSGYEANDRAVIERALRDGTLQGVVATSALELGIDIADVDIGINLGVPQSRKSFRQRLGRIGRTSPGLFLVVAPTDAFTRFGESLSEYYESLVEPSYLYLGNRFIQFAHARCLRDETEALGRNSEVAPSGVNWPEDFPGILKVARGGFSREFDAMAQIGADTPHFNYPLRQLGETNVDIQQGSGGFRAEIGDMAFHQAIREAFPGATYLHMGRAYKVNQWKWGFNKLAIRVTATNNASPTKPILRKSVTIDLSGQGIIPGREKKGSSGFLAEAQVQVNESVEGFSIGNSQFLYRDERARNPNMKRQQRDFRTTGVVVKIEEDWFSDRSVRREVADGLRDLLARERSIAPQDIDSTYTNIALVTESGLRRSITDVIVVYDSVYGGLRLTEDLFDAFTGYVKRLAYGIVGKKTAEQLSLWAQGLSEAGTIVQTLPVSKPPSDGNWLQVFRPGSFVGVFIAGNAVERELMEPKYIDPFDTGSRVLYYIYRDDHNKSGTSYTPGDAVQPMGHDWEWVWWNPDTDEYRDLEVSE